MGFYTARNGIILPTFRDYPSVRSWRAERSSRTAWSLQMEPVGFPETSVTHYHHTLRKIPQKAQIPFRSQRKTTGHANSCIILYCRIWLKFIGFQLWLKSEWNSCPWVGFGGNYVDETKFFFVQWTNKCTTILQIITLLLHVSTLLCHLQGACNQYHAKLHKDFKCICYLLTYLLHGAESFLRS